MEGEQEVEALEHYHRALRHLEGASRAWSGGLRARTAALIRQARLELDLVLELLRPG